jgi:glutaredoxin
VIPNRAKKSTLDDETLFELTLHISALTLLHGKNVSGLKVVEITVDFDATLKLMHQRTKTDKTPQIFINEQHIGVRGISVGFAAFKQILGFR